MLILAPISAHSLDSSWRKQFFQQLAGSDMTGTCVNCMTRCEKLLYWASLTCLSDRAGAWAASASFVYPLLKFAFFWTTFLLMCLSDSKCIDRLRLVEPVWKDTFRTSVLMVIRRDMFSVWASVALTRRQCVAHVSHSVFDQRWVEAVSLFSHNLLHHLVEPLCKDVFRPQFWVHVLSKVWPLMSLDNAYLSAMCITFQS